MTAQTAADIRAAMALIDTPEKWCQGAYAKTKRGRSIGPLEKNAVAHCVLGAAMAATRQDCRGRRLKAFKRALDRLSPDHSLISWQDEPHRTHAEVLALMELAAQFEERTP